MYHLETLELLMFILDMVLFLYLSGRFYHLVLVKKIKKWNVPHYFNLH
ncbi:hypothetical protein ABVS_1656 [Acinetobacter lwoffii]|nr:hypothetical protein ABVS_1656 [Acinetobacter lwoffii]